MLLARDVGQHSSRLSEHPVADVERRQGPVLVHLAGEFDLYNAPALKASLLEIATEQPERLVIDLQDVDLVDSTALGVLIETRSRLENKKAFLLAAPGHDTRRAFTISGLGRHLSLHETVEFALTATVS